MDFQIITLSMMSFSSILPEGSNDDYEKLFTTYIAGKRSYHLRVELPRIERFEQSKLNNRQSQESFYSNLPDNLAGFFVDDFQYYGPTGSDYTRDLVDNLNALDLGESFEIEDKTIPFGSDPSHYTLGAPLISFNDRDSYIAHELTKIRNQYGDRVDGLTEDVFAEFLNLKREQAFLSFATPENFEVFRTESGAGNVSGARSALLLSNTFSALDAPGRFVREQALQQHDSTPDDFKQVLTYIDPRFDSFADIYNEYPQVLGRVRFSFNSTDAESFGISATDISDTVLDPTNLIPIPIIDDLLGKGIKLSGAGLRVGAGAISGGTRLGVDVAKEIAQRIPTGGIEKLRSLSRGVPDVDSVSYRSIDDNLEPTRLNPTDHNVEQLRDVLNKTNPEFTNEFTNDVLRNADGERVAGITDQNRMIIRVALNYGNPTTTTYHEALHGALNFLPDNSKRLLQDAFSGGAKGWQETAADAYAAFNRSASDSGASSSFTRNTVVGRVFTEIGETFQKLNNFFRQRGYQTSDDVFGRIQSGQAYSEAAGLPPAVRRVIGRDVPFEHTGTSSTSLGQGTYEVIESSNLITSHNLERGVLVSNPNYTSHYQGRALNTDNFARHIFKISHDLQPNLLVNTNPLISSGVPIITRYGTVLSGNGRVLGLRQAASIGNYDAYTNYLRKNLSKFGLSSDALDGFDNPVLVRVAGDPDLYERVARFSNFTATLSTEDDFAIRKNLTDYLGAKFPSDQLEPLSEVLLNLSARPDGNSQTDF